MRNISRRFISINNDSCPVHHIALFRRHLMGAVTCVTLELFVAQKALLPVGSGARIGTLAESFVSCRVRWIGELAVVLSYNQAQQAAQEESPGRHDGY